MSNPCGPLASISLTDCGSSIYSARIYSTDWDFSRSQDRFKGSTASLLQMLVIKFGPSCKVPSKFDS